MNKFSLEQLSDIASRYADQTDEQLIDRYRCCPMDTNLFWVLAAAVALRLPGMRNNA